MEVTVLLLLQGRSPSSSAKMTSCSLLKFLQKKNSLQGFCGVGVHPDVMTKFEALKTNRAHRFISFIISDNLEIQVDITAPPAATYDDFIDYLKSLDKKDCRYAVYDFEWTLPDGALRSKILFYVWCPDTANTKKKMLYASSKDSIRKKFQGIVEIQATDFAEVDYDNVKDKASQGAGNR